MVQQNRNIMTLMKVLAHASSLRRKRRGIYPQVIQNGSPDGLALVDATDMVIQFLSYEGLFMALEGLAIGMTSIDIGVGESGTTAVGNSLQLIGMGTDSSDFTWTGPIINTFGAVNTRQTFTEGGQQPVPEPSTIFLLGSGLTGLSFWRWKQRQQNPQA